MGAWGYGAFDNDTACEWMDGVTDAIRFILNHGFWSRYHEEGIAAARLLMDLPESLKERLGPHPLAEALEIVEAELAPEVIKQWKHPAKRLKFLTVLKSDLEYSHRHYLKLDNARRKRVSKRMRVIFSREPKQNPRSAEPIRAGKPRRMQTKKKES